MLAQLYLAYEEKLKSILDKQTGEPFFKHFDLWNQNVEFIEEETPFETPAIFVEFLPIDWKTMGRQQQDANLTVRFHIVTEWQAQTAQYTPEDLRNRALRYLMIPSILVHAMQGFCTPFTNGLMRTKTVPNHDHDRYVDSVEEFECRIQDNSAERHYKMMKLPPELSVELK